MPQVTFLVCWWQSLQAPGVDLPRMLLKKCEDLCCTLYTWAAALKTCWQLLCFLIMSVQPLEQTCGLCWLISQACSYDLMTGIMSLGIRLTSINLQLQLFLLPPFFFFLRNKPLRTVVQHNALLSIMSIRCPHMLVARGYFNYIFSINSRVLCMRSLNEVPDSQISILNTTL